MFDGGALAQIARLDLEHAVSADCFDRRVVLADQPVDEAAEILLVLGNLTAMDCDRQALILNQNPGAGLREGHDFGQQAGQNPRRPLEAADSSVGVADLGAMLARRGDRQWCEKRVEIAQPTAANQRQRTRQPSAQRPQQGSKPRRHDDRCRGGRDIDKRSVDIKKQGPVGSWRGK